MKVASYTAVLIVVTAFAGIAEVRSADRLDEPFVDGTRLRRETFGDDKNIRLFAQLLLEEDPLVREQAAIGLGHVHNVGAMPFLQRALADDVPAVRAAAITAAAEYKSARASGIIEQGLEDQDRQVALVALGAARRMKLAQAGPKIVDLLGKEGLDAILLSTAIHTLTELGHPIESDRLKELMLSRSVRVRLRATENALLSREGTSLASDLTRLEGKDAPAVRGAALAALGRFDFASAQPLVKAARTNKNPLVRRGALRAYENAGQGQQVLGFLTDESPLVVLTATKAAGRLKRTDCVRQLYRILSQTPDDDLHFAARKSLRQIGNDATHQLASQNLKATWPMVLKNEKGFEGAKEAQIAARAKALKAGTKKDKNKDKGKEDAVEKAGRIFRQLRAQRSHLIRNIRSYCVLLAHFNSRQQLDLRLEMLKDLPIDSLIQLDLAPSLAAAGDKRSIQPLIKRLEYCRTQAMKWLIAQTMMNPPYVEYRNDVTGEFIRAAGDLKATEATDIILKIVRTTYQQGRLHVPTMAAAQAMRKLATPSNRTGMEKVVVVVLTDERYSKMARFEISKAAGQLKLFEAVPHLEQILNEERYSRETMTAAAWALQEITDITPSIPDPVLNQSGEWIIRQVGD